MTDMDRQLQDVLDEHENVYGDDGRADFDEIAAKYRDHTADALEELQAALLNSSFS